MDRPASKPMAPFEQSRSTWLALGVWSGSSKAFEVIYLVLWYLGPINHVSGLDFINDLPPFLAVYLAAGLALFAFAYLGRVLQLRRA